SARFSSPTNDWFRYSLNSEGVNPMPRRSLLDFCILCAAVLIGCGKTETMSNNSKMAENSNKSTTAATTTKETTAPAGEKIGVPECDEFIAKYEPCVADK